MRDSAPAKSDAFSRRALILAAGTGLVGSWALASARAKAQDTQKTVPSMSKSPFVYVGCRTSRERNAQGDGISVFRVEPGKTAWTPVQVLKDLVNPSYLALARDGRTLYAVHGDTSDISAFRVDAASGQISPLNRQTTHGLNPVHLTFDPSGKFIVVANHVTKGDLVSGLAVLPVQADGALGEATHVLPLSGKIGPHRVEQPFAKPHQVRYDPSNRFILVPDKGRDVTEAYSLSLEGKLSLAQPPAAVAREGAGPRHIAFHPVKPFAYVINELDSTVVAHRYVAATGELTPFQMLSSLPDTWVKNARAAEIEVSVDGRFVYASNRFNDTIAIFAIDPTSGRLKAVDWVSCAGKTPRFFAFAPGGRTLYVANEESHTVEAFDVRTKDGRLSHRGTAAATGSPTCLVFSA